MPQIDAGVANRENKYGVIGNALTRIRQEVVSLESLLDQLRGNLPAGTALGIDKKPSALSFSEIYEGTAPALYELSDRIAKFRETIQEMLI